MSTTRTNWTLSQRDLDDVVFHVQPKDAGQIVEYSYGLWADGFGGGLVIQRVHDRSDNTTSYYAAEVGETFEPQNGDVEIVDEYLPLVVR